MILERQQSVVSGDVEKIKVHISNKLTSLCRQKRKSKYKLGTCLQDTVFLTCSPLLPHRIPSPPTRRTEKGHAGAFQTFSLCRWGGNGLTIRQNPHSFSLLPPEKDRVCHRAVCNRYPASPRKTTASATGHGNEGARAVCNRYPASPRKKIASATGHGNEGAR